MADLAQDGGTKKIEEPVGYSNIGCDAARQSNRPASCWIAAGPGFVGGGSGARSRGLTRLDRCCLRLHGTIE